MKLLVLDGNSLVNRAFYGIKILTTKKGVFTNAIYGFLTMLNKLLDETKPDAVAVAFDLPEPTFRHKAYDGYKAKRKGMPGELAQQMPILKELLTSMGYKIVTCTGYEADDILGTLAKTCESTGDVCVLATGDRDSLQLVSDSTTVRLATTKFGQPQVTLYDKDKIFEEYGVSPLQLIDIKSIQGDSSDNIPGVAGIGPKGAGELIKKYGSLGSVYEHLEDEAMKPAVKKKLEASKDNAFMSHDLGTIRTDADIDTIIKDYAIGEGDKQKASEMLTDLEMFSLLDKFGLSAPAEQAVQEAEIPKVVELEDGAQVLPRTEDLGEAYFSVSYGENSDITKIAFNINNVIYVFVPDRAFLTAFFKSSITAKYTGSLKDLHKAALRIGINGAAAGRFDAILAAYLLNPSAANYDILRLASEYRIPVPAFEDKLLQEASAMPALCRALEKEIDENGQEKLLREIEIPLTLVLAKMEHVGFYVDKEKIEAYGRELEIQIEDLRASILSQAGYEFNINSPKQLGEALFDKMGLPHGKKTKTGWSTNAQVLEELSTLHPVVEKVLQYRTLSKLKSTYCDGLVKEIAADRRIHSSFNQTETRTGRISSTEPNLQNIPVRTAVGRELRKFFEAENGILVDADYSQIELRVLADVSDDKAMQEDFAAGRDIHTSTAARVFNMPVELVTGEMRSRAKAVNFGIVYGIGAFSLSKDIGVSVKEADEYIKGYLHNYSGVAKYMEKVVEEAKEKGYVETMFGRRRYLPELKSTNFNNRSFGERVARNMPIQGAAADIIKIAMIRVSKRLERDGLAAQLILQIHDELIVECPDTERDVVTKLLVEEMEGAVSLAVNMQADAGSGKTWYDAKG